jgi:hypothetical protein
MPPASEDPPEPATATPAGSATTTGATRTPPPATRPPDRATPPTATTPPDPTPVLQTTPNTAELEKRILQKLDAARRDLDKLNPVTLSKDARAQYDWARQLARQADEALKVRNYNYADQLADKAARLASLLVKG